ncbi:DUF6338 family protein [Actinomadura sp. 1N219]|uniref:DUF6338 family protein n=1 Tax=Actinomadura sp. 1N219 TaxID=3375152 RepID=UPI00379B6441
MVPSSVAAVVVFLVLVTPGTAFELLWQRTRPRRDESAFIEVSRVVLTGVVFSAAATATLAGVAALVTGSAVDPVALLRDGGRYVDRHPALTIRSLAALLGLALLYAVAAHDLLTPPNARRIVQETAWHTAFSRMAGRGARAFLSVQLKDGTTVTGYSAGYSTEPDPAKRDLLLAAPLAIRPPGDDEAKALERAWQTLAISGAEISTIAACYVTRPDQPAGSGTRPRAPTWLRERPWRSCLAGAAGIVALLIVFSLI